MNKLQSVGLCLMLLPMYYIGRYPQDAIYLNFIFNVGFGIFSLSILMLKGDK